MNKIVTPSKEWQALWFSTRQVPWNSIAIVPSDITVDAPRVAARLHAAAKLHGERRVNFLNAQGIELGEVKPVIDAVHDATARGEWVIVAVDPVWHNPGAIPIARATSHALLVVHLGQSLLNSARAAIKAVGQDRLLGSIVLDRNLSLS